MTANAQEPLKLADVVQHWKNLPHQAAALRQLDGLVKQYVPADRLLAVTQAWRQPSPPTAAPPVDCFKRALAFTLRWEGGWSAHPSDPGGSTMRGVTQATYNEYRRGKGLAYCSVRQVTDSELEDIYCHLYWQPSRAGEMVLPLAVVQFDTAVNFGVRGAYRLLQAALKLPADGVFGPQTAAKLATHNTPATALAYVEERMSFRHRRVRERPSQQVFLQGWLNRDRDLKAFVARL